MKVIRSSELQYVPASHEEPTYPQVWKKVLFTFKDLVSGQVMMVNWAKLPVSKTFRRHLHEDMQEVFIIISGKVEMIINKEIAILEKGDAVLVDIKEEHEMKNIGDEDAYYVMFGIAIGKEGKTIIT